MTEFLLKKFVKTDDFQNHLTREKVGTLASGVGILCNVLLFIMKLMIGFFSNSIAIISDSFNNLSDSAGNVVALLGYKLANKPADKEHPFGHGRYEYLTSLIIAMLILYVGIELIQNSIDKLLNPTPIIFSYVSLLILCLSIAIKLWMAFFYKKLSFKINSGVLLATSKDSLNDIFATCASVFSLVFSLFSDIQIDGYIGVIVSLFIFHSGYEIIRNTIDELLGKPADSELMNKIKDMLLKSSMILDVHDLLIHDYGPGKLIGSAHVEVDAKEEFLLAHDEIDLLERKILSELNILMTLHLDPVETDNKIILANKKKVEVILMEIDESLSFHDFRAVVGPTHINLIFDVVVPFDCSLNNEQIKEILDRKLNEGDLRYFTVLTFDREY